jgi:hypothetical protein
MRSVYELSKHPKIMERRWQLQCVFGKAGEPFNILRGLFPKAEVYIKLQPWKPKHKNILHVAQSLYK